MTSPAPILPMGEAAALWLDRATARIALRLAEHLRQAAGAAGTGAAIAGLEARAADVPAPGPLVRPVAGLVARHRLDALDLDLVLLAGLSEEDEAYGASLSHLHPTGRPRAWIGLALRFLVGGAVARVRLRDRIRRLIGLGLLAETGGEMPFPLADLCPEAGIWAALQGAGPDVAAPFREIGGMSAVVDGLGPWLSDPALAPLRLALREGRAATLVLVARDTEMAAHRAAALCASEGVGWRHLAVDPGEAAAGRGGMLRRLGLFPDLVPVLHVDLPGDLPIATDHPGPVILACREGAVPALGGRPSHVLTVTPLGRGTAARMWQSMAPDIVAAPLLAGRFPVEPFEAARALGDLSLTGAPVSVAAIGAALTARARPKVPACVALSHPVAGWDQIVLGAEARAQLEDAVTRLDAQTTVLDRWRFLADRRGARGVRLLFAGPPGTGKTLAAEVLAGALGTGLMEVDLSRLVSKWLGETEKNLSAVFAAAEATRAVLFFDEADALFGKRTEANDAQDRYANLETAYLLARLESYDGLAVLATNFRRSLDPAFTRRLDHIVEFRAPSAAERLALWRAHLPEAAPLGRDVDLVSLARLYPMVGGEIRNACLAAAYLAAGQGRSIGQSDFLQAVRREYEKAGKAFREITATAADDAPTMRGA